MSILSDFVHDIASLLFSARCAVCGEPLARGERTVCTFCRATAPLTGYWDEADNPVARKCWGLVPVERASGFLFFVHASGWRRLIHGFKYRGAWRTAREMGRVVRAAPETERALRRCRGRGSDAPASFPAVPEGLQPVGIPRRGNRLATGRRGRPPQCPPQAQYAQPGPQITPRPGPQCRGSLCGPPSPSGSPAACAAGRRRDDPRATRSSPAPPKFSAPHPAAASASPPSPSRVMKWA